MNSFEQHVNLLALNKQSHIKENILTSYHLNRVRNIFFNLEDKYMILNIWKSLRNYFSSIHI